LKKKLQTQKILRKPNEMKTSQFSKLKEFDLQGLLAENTNLKVLLSSIQSEKNMELQVLKAQNKEYCEILSNIQQKTLKNSMEIQQNWEKKYFILENKNKKLEVDLEKNQRLLHEIQANTKENELFNYKELEKNRFFAEDFHKIEQEVIKWQEKNAISEERISELLMKNEFLYKELQKYKEIAENSERKIEKYLEEFKRKVVLFENEYNKEKINNQVLQRENQGKLKKIDILQSEVLEYKEKLEKIQENSHHEINEMNQDFVKKYQEIQRKYEFSCEELEKMKSYNRDLQREIEEIKGYYSNLMGNLQENIRNNLKETLSNSKLSTPNRKENLSERGFNNGDSGKSDLDFGVKFIHKYN